VISCNGSSQGDPHEGGGSAKAEGKGQVGQRDSPVRSRVAERWPKDCTLSSGEGLPAPPGCGVCYRELPPLGIRPLASHQHDSPSTWQVTVTLSPCPSITLAPRCPATSLADPNPGARLPCQHRHSPSPQTRSTAGTLRKVPEGSRAGGTDGYLQVSWPRQHRLCLAPVHLNNNPPSLGTPGIISGLSTGKHPNLLVANLQLGGSFYWGFYARDFSIPCLSEAASMMSQ